MQERMDFEQGKAMEEEIVRQFALQKLHSEYEHHPASLYNKNY